MSEVFLSYTGKDKEGVVALQNLLERSQISTWRDKDHIDRGDDFTSVISEQLPLCKGMIVWYSKNYAHGSKGGKWELHTAYLAAQSIGEAWEHILIINPEDSDDHIMLPAGLAGQARITLRDITDIETELPTIIRKWLSKIDAPFGSILPRNRTTWYGRTIEQAPYYFGRTLDMWWIDERLNSSTDVRATGDLPIVSLQIRGLGGTGKSLLATQYGLDFGYAYPGGVFWLNAGGDNRQSEGKELVAELNRQLANFAVMLQISIDGLSPADIRNKLNEHFENDRTKFESHENRRKYKFLWIVDDFPGNQRKEVFENWLAPNNHGCTLITTRSHDYENLGRSYDLAQLDNKSAYDLLTKYRKPNEHLGEEKKYANIIANDALGNHALSLEVAAAALRYSTSPTPFKDYHSSLFADTLSELEKNKDYLAELPTGHEKSIAATLWGSIQQLDQYGRTILILASVLAAAPIPAAIVVNVFKNRLRLDYGAAQELVSKAISRAISLSLVSQDNSSPPAYSIHSLVTKFAGYAPESISQVFSIREAAIEVVLTLIKRTEGVTQLTALLESEALVKHGTHLARSVVTDGSLDLRFEIGNYYFKRGDYFEAEYIYSELGNTYAGAPLSERNYLVKEALARAYLYTGKYSDAESLQNYLIRDASMLWGERHPKTITARTTLGKTLKESGKKSDAKDLLETEWAHYSDEPLTLTTSNLMMTLASVLKDLGFLGEAEELQAKGLAYLRDKEKEGTLNEQDALPYALNELGLTLNLMGHYQPALKYLEEAKRLRVDRWGEIHPNTVLIDNNIAFSLLGLGGQENYKMAEERLLNAIDVIRRSFGGHHKKLIPLYFHLGISQFRQGKTKEGIAKLEEARELCRSCGKDDTWPFFVDQQLALMHQDKYLYVLAKWFRDLINSERMPAGGK